MSAHRTKELALALLELTDGASEEESKKATKLFAEYLQKNGQLKNAEAIIAEYRALYNKKHESLEATITLVNRLPEKTRIHLREALKKKYKAREVHILEKVDERLIGGMKIQIGDTVYDSSLKNSLKQLEAQLLR